MSKTATLKQSAAAANVRQGELSEAAMTLSIMSQQLAQQADAIPQASRQALTETAQTVAQTVAAVQQAASAIQTTAQALQSHALDLAQAAQRAQAPSLKERLTLAVVVGILSAVITTGVTLTVQAHKLSPEAIGTAIVKEVQRQQRR